MRDSLGYGIDVWLTRVIEGAGTIYTYTINLLNGGGA